MDVQTGSACSFAPPLALSLLFCMSQHFCCVLGFCVIHCSSSDSDSPPVPVIALLVCLLSKFLGLNLQSVALSGHPHPGLLPSELMPQPPWPSGCGSSPNAYRCSQTQDPEWGDPTSTVHTFSWSRSPGPATCMAPLTHSLSRQCLVGSCSPRNRMQKPRRTTP